MQTLWFSRDRDIRRYIESETVEEKSIDGESNRLSTTEDWRKKRQ